MSSIHIYSINLRIYIYIYTVCKADLFVFIQYLHRLVKDESVVLFVSRPKSLKAFSNLYILLTVYSLLMHRHHLVTW